MATILEQQEKQELEKQIDSITKSCKPFINKMLKDLAGKNPENSNNICDHIIAEQTDFNIKDSTKIGKIKALLYLSRFCNDKNFKEMKKQDILDHLNTFRPHHDDNDNNNQISANNKWIGTYNFRQMIFAKFFRWLYNPDEPDPTKKEKPDCMQGVRKLPRKEKSSYSGDIWDQRENAIFLKYSNLKRDRCFHSMAMDTSCRPHELLNLKIKDIEFSKTEDGKQYALVRIKHGKTGPRTVPLIDSLPYLKEYLQDEHPCGSNPDSWLFVSTGNNHGSRLSYEGLVNRYDYFKKKYFPSLLLDATVPDPDKSVIRYLLTKPFNPYVLRHSSLTEKSTILTEAVLRSHAGWSADSSIPKIYIHLSDESSKILLEKRGLLSNKDKEISTINKSRICVNCQEPNRPDAQWCISCKMILSYDAYNKTLEKQNEREQELEQIKDQMLMHQSLMVDLLDKFETWEKSQKKEVPEILKGWNNRTEKRYRKNGLDVPERLDEQEKYFLRLVDAEKYPVEKEITKIVRIRAPDYGSKKRETKEFLYWFENWYGKDWQGRKVAPVTDHVEGNYWEQELEPVIEREQLIGYDRSGQHEVYYVPFSKKAVDEIIAKSTFDNKEQIKFLVKTPTFRNDEFSYQQFVETPWDECVSMIMYNGGPPRYEYDKKQKEKKDAEIQKQNKQYS